LGEVAFADADLTDDEYGSVFAQVAVGGQIVHERAVELWEPIEVELIEGFVGAKGGAAQAQRELFMFSARDLVLDQQSEEVGVGELGVDRFSVTRIQGIEDPGEAQLFEQGDEFGNRVHAKLLQG
jgi:hypothetical protein